MKKLLLLLLLFSGTLFAYNVKSHALPPDYEDCKVIKTDGSTINGNLFYLRYKHFRTELGYYQDCEYTSVFVCFDLSGDYLQFNLDKIKSIEFGVNLTIKLNDGRIIKGREDDKELDYTNICIGNSAETARLINIDNVHKIVFD